RCLVIERRKHVGGNLYCEEIEGIHVHMYGAHIFHTNDKKIWDFVNSLIPFNNFINSPLAMIQSKIYNLPFNMNTFYQLWAVFSPTDATRIINAQTEPYIKTKAKNLEDKALATVGPEIYEMFIKGYTEKQWGKKPSELPVSIINRIPLRFNFNNNYFNDLYQGIPIGGYNPLVAALLRDIEVKTNVDFFKERSRLEEIADHIVYTGRIDELYEFCFGKLDYRSLRFDHKVLEVENFQGNAVVNYPEREVPYTRVIEHKQFEFGNQPNTVITYEYPEIHSSDSDPYYPINDERNSRLYKKYVSLARQKN